MVTRISFGLIASGLLFTSAASARTLQLSPRESSVRIHVGKAGVFSAFAHEHDVAAPAFQGTVAWSAADFSDGQVRASFDARQLTVLPEPDAAKVQATMRGPQVLDSDRFPRIVFTSKRVVSRGPSRLEVQGELELHGKVKPVTVPLSVEVTNDRLVASGTVVLRQTWFGITPIRIAGGTVTVADDITVQLKLVAR